MPNNRYYPSLADLLRTEKLQMIKETVINNEITGI